MENLSGNSVSTVWTDGGYYYKKQPKHLCDNEWYALRIMNGTGYVPSAERIDDETIRMDAVVNEEITDEIQFRDECYVFLKCLEGRQLRHGDLTPPHIFVVNDKPMVIDWAESRIWNDPRPDKRREGDKHWMEHSVEKIIEVQRSIFAALETDL